MEHLTGEIRRALEAKLWLVALQSTMAAIDICGSLAASNGRATGPHFKAWCSENMGPEFVMVSADDLYQLRCGILHQGRSSAHGYDKVLFTLPDPHVQADHNMIERVMNLDLVNFVEKVCTYVDHWWAASKDTEPVRTNAEFLVRVRQERVLPWMPPSTVIA